MSRELLEKISPLGTVLKDEPLKNHTSFKTGGPADMLVFPRDVSAISELVGIACMDDIPLTVIGGGSNLLVGDRGIRGIVMALSEKSHRQGSIRHEGNGRFYCDAVVSKERFIGYAMEAGYCGMEFMAGIPGCVGGGIIMNAGTIDGSFVDILGRIEVVNGFGEVSSMEVSSTMAVYRKLDIGAGLVVTGGYFNLTEAPDRKAVQKRIDAILDDRKSKHPLDYPSAGSVFKNPEGHSSWQLIDRAGLKGFAVGGAKVSDLHTNFIINTGGATSHDIKNLIQHIQERIYQMYKIEIEPEIRMMGEF